MYWFFGIIVVIVLSQSYRYLKLFKYPKKCKNLIKKDCVIVCGYPANDDGSISGILKSRVEKAVELYKQGYVRYLIFSGTNAHNEHVEANVMREYALIHGIKEEDIILETQAKSTYHNMMYSQKLMEQYHLKTCYVITNSWHLRKADYYSRKFDLDYEMISSYKPDDISYFKMIGMHIDMHISTYVNLLKGYS